MREPDALQGEMPGFPFPGRPGGEYDEPLLDMILDGRAIPPDAPREMHDLERMLAALAGPTEPGELAGEAAARAAFIRLASPAGISPGTPRPVRHRLPRRPVTHRKSRRPARPRAGRRAGLAAALFTAVAALVSTAAAYAGVLPDPIQQVAHVTVGAPAPHHPRSSTPSRHRDADHGLGPAGQPAPQPVRSPGSGQGHDQGSTPRLEPPRLGQQPTPSCPPGQQLRGHHCSVNNGQDNGQETPPP